LSYSSADDLARIDAIGDGRDRLGDSTLTFSLGRMA